MKVLIREDPSCYASRAQQDVLQRMSGLNIVAENFFITGGTTLAVFYLHHRISEDIDFFTTSFRDLNRVDQSLRRLFRKDIIPVQSTQDFFSYLIEDVKVDLVFDPLSNPEPRPLFDLKNGTHIRIDTLDHIASNKLAAVASRTEPKDLIDLYFIGDVVWQEERESRFEDCLKTARSKEALFDDPATAAWQIEELLDRVIRQREKILPPLKKTVDWERLERDFRMYIERLYGMETWG
jgi:predicted nucleotidyltransferase component of viral defense system